ncbi:MAG: OmpA family protein [bacterium]|nr:OmpA family protein [bacterium]
MKGRNILKCVLRRTLFGSNSEKGVFLRFLYVPLLHATMNKMSPAGLRTFGSARLFQSIAPYRGSGLRKAIVSMFMLFLIPVASAAATPPGTTISNTASASYSVGALNVTTPSNKVDVVTVQLRTNSTIEFMQYAPLVASAEQVNITASDYATDSSATVYNPLPAPTPPGSATPLDLTDPVPLVPSTSFHRGQNMFIKLTDIDQNLDDALTESVIVTLSNSVTGDIEIVRIYETGPDTGIFAGYIKSAALPAANYDGDISAAEDTTITASYTDNTDNSDTEAVAALVDPYGVILNSLTGQPVNGATVTLINADTGLPALVFGDDGVSEFPATVISGGTASDASGAVYNFPPGNYRFPFVLPGNYRFDVDPPNDGTGPLMDYVAPSSVSTADLQALPGAPFAIVNPGSRGEVFVVNPGPALHIDYPIDPLITGLYVRKEAGRQDVAPGDFLPYRVNVLNASANDATGVVLADRLPSAFRYRKGSATLDGTKVGDPAISADGRTLTFPLGTILTGESRKVSYVVEVGISAMAGEAVNVAAAKADGGVSSNDSRASVTVREELFGSENIIVGSLWADGCGLGEAPEKSGVEGVRIFMEDGTFAVTDENGAYHFKGVRPGSHNIQLDLDTVPPMFEVVNCEENSRFAGRGFSQFVDLQKGTMWRADFHLSLKPRMKGEVSIELKSVFRKEGEERLIPLRPNFENLSASDIAGLGADGHSGNLPAIRRVIKSYNTEAGQQVIDYEVPFNVGNISLENLRMTVILPDGVQYIDGSSSYSGFLLNDPFMISKSMTFSLGRAEANSEHILYFSALAKADNKMEDLVTRAMLTFNSANEKNLRTPFLENILGNVRKEEKVVIPDLIMRPRFDALSDKLSEEDKVQLNDIVDMMKSSMVKHVYVTGHSDSTKIRSGSRGVFPDNYALSMARAKSVADYIMKALNLDPSQFTIIGEGPDSSIADNNTEEGRALNRRVEIRVISERLIRWSYLQPKKDKSGIERIETVGMRPGEPTDAGYEVEEVDPFALYKKPPEDFEPGLEWVFPEPGFNPPIPSTKVMIKHDIDVRIALRLNGKEVNKIYFEGTDKNVYKNVALSRWLGIYLQEGDNEFEVISYGRNGREMGRLFKVLHYSGAPVSVELVPQKSILVADGKTVPIVAVRLLDQAGEPVRKDVSGDYALDPPYLPEATIDKLDIDPLTGAGEGLPKYKVTDEGIAYIKLAPTTKTGEAVLRFNLAGREQEIRPWIESELRDWILVGLAEGTAGYNTLSGNMEGLSEKGTEKDLYYDGRLALYAKGRIKGNWLLTMAYDSEKVKDEGKLHQTVDPDSYYTLYGDGSEQQHDAASGKKLYLKIERKKFYALFGDYNTGLNVTELSRYNRSMTGLKSEMKGELFDYNIYASDTNNAFIKDEIIGDGTSGLYKMSRKNVVINSESIELEVRDRFRSEVIISSQKLSRHLDYSIDYDEGTIYFREPVYSRDGNFNPQYIVIDYEANDSGDTSYNYGGRGVAHLLENKLSLGVSHVHEGRVGGEGNLYGVDTKLKIAGDITLKAEFASTDSDYTGVKSDGDAYLAEVSKKFSKGEGTIYYREMNPGFGLGQQRGSESGMRKIGLSGIYLKSESIKYDGLFSRQTNIATGAERDHAEIKSTYSDRRYSLSAGLRNVIDRFADGSTTESNQVNVGGSLSTMGDLLKVRLSHDQSLFGRNDNADYPTRTTVGADYMLSQKTTLFADQEFATGASEDSESLRLGFRTNPWTGGKVNASIDRNYSENGARVFSNLGLKQTVKLSDRLSLDGGLDRSKTINKGSVKRLNLSAPSTSGAREDFTALSLGLAYKREKWSLTSRVEVREADNSDKAGAFAGINGELREGLGMAAGLKIFKTDYITGDEQLNADLRLSLASRPIDSKWIVLDRLDLIYDDVNEKGFDYDSWRIVNNLHANYKSNYRTQIGLQYGAKYLEDRIDNTDYKGYTDLIGLEGRYDVTKKMDFALNARQLHSWNIGLYDYGYGVSLGYNFVENVWASLGYNFAGFMDKDFSGADYTAKGTYIKFRIKFDQKTIRDLAKGDAF